MGSGHVMSHDVSWPCQCWRFAAVRRPHAPWHTWQARFTFLELLNQFHLCSVKLETQPSASLSADPRIVVYADGSICIFDGLGALKHQQPALPAGPVLCIASGRYKQLCICIYIYTQNIFKIFIGIYIYMHIHMYNINITWGILGVAKSLCIWPILPPWKSRFQLL